MGASNIVGMFGPQGGKEHFPQYQADPYTSGTQGALGQFFTAAGQNQFNAPQYPGQMSADWQYLPMAQQMFEGAVGGYNPQRMEDIYSRYSNIADTGFAPQYQSYLDSTSRAASDQWSQNVMPQVAEKSRGFGRGSVMPENIAKAGQNFNVALAGQMAPYGLQAAQAEAQNRLAGVGGMGQTGQYMDQYPMQRSREMLQLAGGFAQPQQQALDRQYQEFQRQQYGLLPQALQFSGQGKGGFMSPYRTDKSTAQRIAGGMKGAEDQFMQLLQMILGMVGGGGGGGGGGMGMMM